MLAVVNNKLKYIINQEMVDVDVDTNKILYPYYDGVLIQEYNYVTNVSGEVISIVLDEPIIYVLISNTLKYYMVTANAVYSDEEKILDYSLPKHALIYDDIGKFSYYDGGDIFYVDKHQHKIKGSLFEHPGFVDGNIYFRSYDLETGIYDYVYTSIDSRLKCKYVGFEYEAHGDIYYYETKLKPDTHNFITETISDYCGRYSDLWVHNKFTNMIHNRHYKGSKLKENSYQIMVVCAKNYFSIHSKINGESFYISEKNNNVEILDEITYDPQPKSAKL